MNILLIVASGKSSRFGGFPKAFCELGDIMNVENTINKAKTIIDKVYIGVNRKVFEQFNSKITSAEMFPIKTGQGDAHSLLKCLKHIKENNPSVNTIMVCWGDAVFVSSKPFEELSQANGPVCVACSLDNKPYAWFDVDERNNIHKSHFAKEEGFIESGMHDQSLFLFDINYAIQYLDDYRQSLGICDDNDEEKSDINEMKLLFSFEYLEKKGNPAKCIQISSDQVLSFNTQEELDEIKQKIHVAV